MLIHRVDDNRVGRVIKTKIIVVLSNEILIGQSAELNKTLAHRPWPTPSAVAPGGGVG